MTEEEERELRAQLARLQQEHRDLDAAIAALQGTLGHDLIQLQRLKKSKLVLRDRITFIEDELTPDIIAWWPLRRPEVICEQPCSRTSPHRPAPALQPDCRAVRVAQAPQRRRRPASHYPSAP